MSSCPATTHSTGPQIHGNDEQRQAVKCAQKTRAGERFTRAGIQCEVWLAARNIQNEFAARTDVECLHSVDIEGRMLRLDGVDERRIRLEFRLDLGSVALELRNVVL